MSLFNMLEAEETDLLGFKAAIRDFFAGIIKFLYKLFSWSIDTMYQLARFDFGMDGFIDSIAEKVFGILIIFMIFRLTLSFLSFIVDPESAFDGKKGIQNIIVKVLLAIIILVFINPVFEVAKEVEKDILDSGVIESLVATNEPGEIVKIDDDVYGYGVHMSSLCNEGSYVYTFSKGDHIALLLLRPFIQPYSELELDDSAKFASQQQAINDGGLELKAYGFKLELRSYNYCGASIEGTELTYISGADNKTALKSVVPGPNAAEDFMYHGMYNMVNTDGNNTYMFDFNYIFATIAGFVAILITISFCFDVVIRSLTILFLKLIAPIPVISSINPKSSDNLTKWAKKMGATWASLFIRIIVLNFAILLITAVCNGLDSKGVQDVSLMMEIFLIFGILMFAKKLPSLIEEMIPGLKLGGLELNPFKRVKKDALGGEAIANAVGRTTGLVTGGIGGAISGAKAGSEVGNKKLGRFLGALSGASAGFQNKKWSVGKGMNEAYRNLTGNEFRRMSPTTMLMNKVGHGQEAVDEAKASLKDGYDQLNSLRTDLNVSENRTAALAQNLMANGYDITKFSVDDLKVQINGEVSTLNAQKNTIEGDVNTLKADMDAAQNSYNSALSTVNGKRAAFVSAKDMYEQSQKNVDSIKEQIFQKQSELNATNPKDRAANAKIRNDLDALNKHLQTESARMATAKANMESADSDVKGAEKSLESFKKTLDAKIKAYNDKVTQLNDVQSALDSKASSIKSLETYASNRTYEDGLRSEISAVEKDIDTIKKEKAQRERFYRIDPAPQQDYDKARQNIENRKK